MRKLSVLAFVISLLMLSIVQAEGGLEVVSVQVNDQEVDWVNNVLIKETEPVKVRVGLTAFTNLEDLELEIKISGYEYENSVIDAVEEVDITANTTKYVNLQLELPVEISEQEEEYLLRLRILDQNGILFEKTVTLATDTAPPQIKVISPENNSIVTEYLVSEIIKFPEAWKIENGEDQIEIGETVHDVISDVGEKEMNALAKNTLLVGGLEYVYEQSLSFDSEDVQNEIVTFAEDFNNYKTNVEELAEDEWKSGIYFQIKKDQQIAKYNLHFETPVPSEINNADRLTDLQGTILTLFDKPYFVYKAEKIYQHGVRLTLMDVSFDTIKYLELEDHDVTDDISTYFEEVQEDSLLEGEGKTYTIDGQEYNVILAFTDSSNKAKFNVNGEPMPFMNEGDSITLSDGISLSLDKVLYQDFAGGVHQAEFSLKAISPSNLIYKDEAVSGAHVAIKGTINTEAASISSIEVDMIAQDDYYVAPGENLLDQPELENKALLFAEDFDLHFEGLDHTVPLHEISIKDQAGEKEYRLKFTNNLGQKIELPIASADNSNLNLGSINNKLNLENSNIADEQYFILNSAADENSVTNVVQYKGADDVASSDPIMKFKILATGETVSRTVSFDSNGVATATLKFSGMTYTITSVENTAGDDYNISVTGGTETSSSNAYGWENYVIGKGGAKIKIAESEIEANVKSIKVEISLIDPDNAGDSVVVSQENPYVISSVDIIAIDSMVDFTNYAGISLTSPENDGDNAYGYAANGAFVKLYNPVLEEHADELVIDWPETQRLPEVYLTTTEAKYYIYYIDLLAETDENAVCYYNLGDGYQIMEQTGGMNHYHPLIGLSFENDYEVLIQCADEVGNINTESTNFYFGEDKVPPKITITSPQNNSTVKKEMLSDITVYSTESWKVEKDGNALDVDEPISNITSIIGGNELTALANNTWLNYEYKQSLSFDLADNRKVTYIEDDEDITDYFLLFHDNKPIATYNLEFTSPAQSAINDKILPDFQETTLTLIGKEYTVLKAERPSQNSIKLTLKNGEETLVLVDQDITDDLSSDELIANSENIDGAAVKIKGNDNGNILSISSLEVKMTTQDEIFIAPGETLLDQAELEEKDLIFTQNWNIRYDGFIDSDTKHPQVYISATVNEGIKSGLPVELTTDEDATCSFALGEDYKEMETGERTHLTHLFDLEEGKDYEVQFKCVDESGNTKTETLKFHFGEVVEEQPPQNPPSNSGSGGGGSSSSSSKKDNKKELPKVEEIVTSNVPEVNEISQPIELLAENPAEKEEVASKNSLTGALIGVAEDGGLLYVAGFILVLFSVLGITIYLKKN